jgi:hypothetical protein
MPLDQINSAASIDEASGQEFIVGKKTVYQKVQHLLLENSTEVLRAVVEGNYWPAGLRVGEPYCRVGDDTNGNIAVSFPIDADGWISILSRLDPEEPTLSHRFRCAFGGGESLRVRNALLVLALAIKLDNDAHPQDHRRKIQNPQ